MEERGDSPVKHASGELRRRDVESVGQVLGGQGPCHEAADVGVPQMVLQSKIREEEGGVSRAFSMRAVNRGSSSGSGSGSGSSSSSSSSSSSNRISTSVSIPMAIPIPIPIPTRAARAAARVPRPSSSCQPGMLPMGNRLGIGIDVELGASCPFSAWNGVARSSSPFRWARGNVRRRCAGRSRGGCRGCVWRRRDRFGSPGCLRGGCRSGGRDRSTSSPGHP